MKVDISGESARAHPIESANSDLTLRNLVDRRSFALPLQPSVPYREVSCQQLSNYARWSWSIGAWSRNIDSSLQNLQFVVRGLRSRLRGSRFNRDYYWYQEPCRKTDVFHSVFIVPLSFSPYAADLCYVYYHDEARWQLVFPLLRFSSSSMSEAAVTKQREDDLSVFDLSPIHGLFRSFWWNRAMTLEKSSGRDNDSSGMKRGRREEMYAAACILQAPIKMFFAYMDDITVVIPARQWRPN